VELNFLKRKERGGEKKDNLEPDIHIFLAVQVGMEDFAINL